MKQKIELNVTCDDCGAPMFPNPAGHSVHAEAPEDAEEQPASPLH